MVQYKPTTLHQYSYIVRTCKKELAAIEAGLVQRPAEYVVWLRDRIAKYTRRLKSAKVKV